MNRSCYSRSNCFALSKIVLIIVANCSYLAYSMAISPYSGERSPNECTEKYGDQYFKRSDTNVCQTCLSVGEAFKKRFYICEYTSIDPHIGRYPAAQSPNECTAKYGDLYFKREDSGRCQACNTVSWEYRKNYTICEFLAGDTSQDQPSDEPDATNLKNFEVLNCASEYRGTGAYNDCETIGNIVTAKLISSTEIEPGRKCEFGVTWGFAENFLWVVRGCGGEFAYCTEGSDCSIASKSEHPSPSSVMSESLPVPAIKPPTTSPAPACKPYLPNHWISYIIQPGDTLSQLAALTGVSRFELQRVNCIADRGLIIAGAKIYLPRRPISVAVAPVPTRPAPVVAAIAPNSEPTRPSSFDEKTEIVAVDLASGSEKRLRVVLTQDLEISCQYREGSDPTFCNVGGSFRNVILLREDFSGGCIAYDTWGFDSRQGLIWVEQGCAGHFLVTF